MTYTVGDRPHPPFSTCPKCGDPFGFVKSSPRYRVDLERLLWECVTCGYVVSTPTADAR